jgi:nickel transport protein
MPRIHVGAVVVSALLLAAFLFGTPAAAHRVHHEVSREEAVVVTLAYGDGSPLAGEQYEIRVAGGNAVWQTGVTDVEGRIAFLPDRDAEWRIRVFTEDGHGADFTVPAGPPTVEPAGEAGSTDRATSVDDAQESPDGPQPVESEPSTPAAATAEKPLVERFAGPVLGVGIILACFGGIALFVRRRH